MNDKYSGFREPTYPPEFFCADCDEGIYEGDKYMNYDGVFLCENCVEKMKEYA